MSGADLANLVNEGALLAARRGHDKIWMADLEEAKDKVMLGAERKSLVMREEERRLTAYHEAGHAVCAMLVKGNDPLHKVTIVPRGRALGVAFTLPEDDRVSVTREQIEARLAMAYGGRVAEELIFGRERVTTGAASDIQQATGSRAGTSAVGPLGPHRPDPRGRQRARGLPRPRAGEPARGQRGHGAARRLRGQARDRRGVRAGAGVLSEHIQLLHAVAASLLERETLTRDDIEVLRRGDQLPPRPTPPSAAPTPVAPVPVVQPRPSAPPLLGGPEPSPA
jgi:cell division protease FtsH